VNERAWIQYLYIFNVFQTGLDVYAKYSKVMTWFNNLMQKDEFSSVSQIVTEGKGPESFKVMVISNLTKLG
jgi:hypothetical protein